MRQETRRERYDKKLKSAKTYPISLCAINFRVDDNLGYLVRSAACFGAGTVHVIGHVPSRGVLNPLSGSLYDYVKIKKYSTPSGFLGYARKEEIKLVSAELVDAAVPISSYDFAFDSRICLVVGQEECGVPVEILKNSDKVYIPLPGVGYCLNTSQAANIMLYEATRQYDLLQNTI